MKEWDILTRILHLFRHKWNRDWAGKHRWCRPGEYSYRDIIFYVDKCEVCGKVRAQYIDTWGDACGIDLDKLILTSPNGLVPYKIGTHEKIYHS